MSLPNNLDQIVNSLKQELIASKTGNKRLKVKSLMKKFNLRRRTEKNTTELAELFRKNDIVINPSIMKSGDNWELDLEDWIYLSIVDGQTAGKEAILKAVENDGYALEDV